MLNHLSNKSEENISEGAYIYESDLPGTLNEL